MTDFKLNSKIELIDEDDESIFGLIHDIEGDKIYVSTTTAETDFKLLHIGDIITGLVFDGGLKGISFDGVVTDRKSDEILIYEITDISNIQPVQRRQNVRVDCSIPVYFTSNKRFLFLDKSNLEISINDIKDESKRGTTLDLSGGGMKLSANERFNLNQELVLLFYIGDKPIVVKARVVHKDMQVSYERTVYNYGIKFLNIAEDEIEIIVRHLFVLMRKNRIR